MPDKESNKGDSKYTIYLETRMTVKVNETGEMYTMPTLDDVTQGDSVSTAFNEHLDNLESGVIMDAFIKMLLTVKEEVE